MFELKPMTAKEIRDYFGETLNENILNKEDRLGVVAHQAQLNALRQVVELLEDWCGITNREFAEKYPQLINVESLAGLIKELFKQVEE